MAFENKLALLAGVAAVASAFTAPALAQDEAAVVTQRVDNLEPVETVEGINNGAISFLLGADVVSKYIFRGYELQEDGVIVQPYAEFTVGIAEGIDVYAGIWNSTGTETNGDNNEHWFESDIYAGVSIGDEILGLEGFALDVSYINYTSPNDLFSQYEEIDVALAYDDSDNDISFNPYVLFAFEFGTDGAGDDDNIYAEVGGELAFEFNESSDYPVALTVPVTVGFSLDEFYVDDEGDNEFFGFVSVGANVGVPLPFIPREYGQWSAAAGLTLFLLNDNAVGLDDGDNDNFNIAGTLGFALEY